MNWTTAALITNVLIWAVMFLDILTDMIGGQDGKDQN